MKRLLVLSAALLFCLVTTASAAVPGINLSWSGCATTPASGDKSYVCDGVSGGVFALEGSFRPSVDVPDFAGCSSMLRIAFAGAVSDYWKVDPQGCNALALSAANPTSNAPCEPTNIFDRGNSFSGFTVEYTTSYLITIRVDCAIGAVPPPSVVAGSLYPAFRFLLDADAGVGIGCTGCSEPGCLVLAGVTVYGFAPSEQFFIQATDVRQYVTWQGGGIGGLGCPGATPSRNRTWGSVKTLYR